MDVSLFERLVMNHVPSVMLAVQHRMRPEVARLIVPSVYKNLENHESVLKHPAVPSINRSVFFLDHDHPEAREEGGSSYYNSHEAAMTLRLAHFLCEQGTVHNLSFFIKSIRLEFNIFFLNKKVFNRRRLLF